MLTIVHDMSLLQEGYILSYTLSVTIGCMHVGQILQTNFVPMAERLLGYAALGSCWWR